MLCMQYVQPKTRSAYRLPTNSYWLELVTARCVQQIALSDVLSNVQVDILLYQMEKALVWHH